MTAPGCVFFLTALITLGVHLSYQIPFYRAVSRLESQYRQNGIRWSYWRDVRLRLRFHADETAIYSEADSPDIRTIKGEIVWRRKAIMGSMPLLLRIAATGFGLTVVAGFIEIMFKS